MLTASESGTTPEVLEACKKMKEMGVRVFAMTKPEGPSAKSWVPRTASPWRAIAVLVAARRAATSPTASACACSTAAAASPSSTCSSEQTKDIWKYMLDIHQALRAQGRARPVPRAGSYTMFIGSGAL